MNSDRIKHGWQEVSKPTPEELECAMRRAARMRAEVLRETPGVFAGWMRRAAGWTDRRPGGVASEPSGSVGNAVRTIVA